MFVVDLGVPRNVASDATGLYNLYLYNIDDLGEIVEQNKKAREAEIPRAESIIAEHIAKFEVWRAALEASSVVDDLRDRFHRHREALLRERLAEMPDVSPQERERLAHITEELIERVLDQPAQRVRRGGNMRGRLGAIDAVRHLFGLVFWPTEADWKQRRLPEHLFWLYAPIRLAKLARKYLLRTSAKVPAPKTIQ